MAGLVDILGRENGIFFTSQFLQGTLSTFGYGCRIDVIGLSDGTADGFIRCESVPQIPPPNWVALSSFFTAFVKRFVSNENLNVTIAPINAYEARWKISLTVPLECPPTYKFENGVCVPPYTPVCGPGYDYDQATNSCKSKCPDGWKWDNTLKECYEDCQPGYYWDRNTKSCKSSVGIVQPPSAPVTPPVTPITPPVTPINTPPVATCPQEFFTCPNGTKVTRNPARSCAFDPCPSTPASPPPASKARRKIPLIWLVAGGVLIYLLAKREGVTVIHE
jgi:hypothetical protein